MQNKYNKLTSCAYVNFMYTFICVRFLNNEIKLQILFPYINFISLCLHLLCIYGICIYK